MRDTADLNITAVFCTNRGSFSYSKVRLERHRTIELSSLANARNEIFAAVKKTNFCISKK
jgi:hypothetical protein